MAEASPPANLQSRLRAVVHGRVQGVNFRTYTRSQAAYLGLVGYVRNREDGAVEVVAQGDHSSLDALLAWLHRGPRLAHVTRVEVIWMIPSAEFDSFEVRY